MAESLWKSHAISSGAWRRFDASAHMRSSAPAASAAPCVCCSRSARLALVPAVAAPGAVRRRCIAPLPAARLGSRTTRVIAACVRVRVACVRVRGDALGTARRLAQLRAPQPVRSKDGVVQRKARCGPRVCSR
eukprot:806203-Pleurochrysis_carterae.AAC.3